MKKNLRRCEHWPAADPPPRYERAHGFNGFFAPFPKVTTKSYQGYYWKPKVAKNGPKQHNKVFLYPKGKKSPDQSPPQELEVGPCGGRIFELPFKVYCSSDEICFKYLTYIIA